MPIDYRQLSKTLSFALRHKPWLFELELDEAGWVAIKQLIAALQENNRKYRDVSLADIEALISEAGKQRFEMQDGKIRALYGHSASNSVQKIPSEPPEYLWHGTSISMSKVILTAGLKPMSRQFVHLTMDVRIAREVASRKGEKVILLTIAALEAHQSGVVFYKGNENVWLADVVPADYIKVDES